MRFKTHWERTRFKAIVVINLYALGCLFFLSSWLGQIDSRTFRVPDEGTPYVEPNPLDNRYVYPKHEQRQRCFHSVIGQPIGLEYRQYYRCSFEPIKIPLHTESQGLGVQWISYYSALSQAIREEKTFLLEGDAWNYGGSCGERNPFECFFARIHDCGEREFGPAKQYDVMLGRSLFLTDPDEPQKSMKESLVMISSLIEPPSWYRGKHSPKENRLNARDWEAQLAAMLFCLREEIVQHAERTRTSLRWQSPTIAMHIRRGDRKDLHKYGVEDYVSRAREIRDKFNITAIFIASDDDSVYDEVQALAGDFHLMNLRRGSDKQNYQWNRNASDADTVHLLTELYLLSECQIFVGAQRSMFAWLISRLIIGKGNELACPYWVGPTSNKYGYHDGREADCI
eukprot:TRINITY_DN3148_c0_g1_i2.p1 TRINITY_DN3148_c0_g1~~TRINITY_DN3148_c0_g1_i2.p1  ORF type:complete len:398 (-),score=35.66 TRINITY_DN3148_c0_g1_i2:131-1324(-)